MTAPSRSSLAALIDELIRVDGGPTVPRDVARPVLVLEGLGGSGRSRMLHDTWERWAAVTPAAMVDPQVLADGDGSMRGVLAAVMLGLTADVPGYDISFPRVVLAHIAMAQQADGASPAMRVEALRGRINEYRDRGAVVRLLAGLLGVGARYLGLGEANLGPSVEEMARRLARTGWHTKLVWKDALAWFGHQDQGFVHDPERALVHLGTQAGQPAADVRQDVDHLLMAALLADLRDGFARAAGHPTLAVLLLDNGDAPSACEFVRTLARVRRELARHQVPRDPLVVITASGGHALADATGLSGRARQWPESALGRLSADDLGRPGALLRVVLDGLAEDVVRQMARATLWPGPLGTGMITSAVLRFTGGHAEATDLVLGRLQEEPRLVDDLGSVVAEHTPDPGRTMECYLIDRIVADLSPRRHLDRHVRDALVTLAGARNDTEARRLTPLLGNLIHAEPVLFTSSPLWSVPCGGERWAMAPFIRFLLLRELAGRASGHPAGWARVFELLRRHAAEDGEHGGRLHYELALGDHESVVDELLRLLPLEPGTRWLALLDEVVAMPVPRARDGERPSSRPASGPGEPPRRHVSRLLAARHRLADPLLSDRGTRHDLYLAAHHACLQLADADLAPFLERARHFEKLAEALS